MPAAEAAGLGEGDAGDAIDEVLGKHGEEVARAGFGVGDARLAGRGGGGGGRVHDTFDVVRIPNPEEAARRAQGLGVGDAVGLVAPPDLVGGLAVGFGGHGNGRQPGDEDGGGEGEVHGS